ncbi:MAG: DUF58 domain-containing protein, partial [Planctomycetales bacterium]|nr:DUF58 domain-containing protein [Planctomycetales bacterium]
FSEHRPYVYGDDQRYVDWKLYARSDRHFVKRFEDETNLRCYLIVDRSRSMNFGASSYTKGDYAATLAATLAMFLMRQHDAVGVMTFAETAGRFIPARCRSGQLRTILAALESNLPGESSDLGAALEMAGKLTPRRALTVVISDLLAPLEEVASRLRFLVAKGHDVAVLQTLDRAELEFPFNDASSFEDLETGRKIYVDPAAARREYLERFAAHQEAVRRLCVEAGVELTLLPTDVPLERALRQFVQLRGAQRTQRVRRERQGRGR